MSQLRFIDFELKIIVDIEHPRVVAAYEAWNALSEELADKPLEETTLAEWQEYNRLKEAFISTAYTENAVRNLE